MRRESSNPIKPPIWLTSPAELARHVDDLRHSSNRGFEETEHQILHSISLAETFGSAHAEAALRRTLLILYRDTQRIIEAIDQGNIALEISDAHDLQHEKIEILIGMSGCMIEAADPTRAFDLLTQAEQLARAEGSRSDMAAVLIAKGTAYGRLRISDESVNCNKVLIEDYEDALPPRRKITVLGNLAAGLNDLGRFEEAIHYLDQGISLQDGLGDRLGNPFLLASQAIAISQTSSLDTVLHLVDQIQEICDFSGREPTLIPSLLEELGGVYLRTGHPAEAVACLNLAKQKCEPIGNLNVLRHVSKLLGSAYQALGQFEQAAAEYENAYSILEAVLKADIDAGIRAAASKQDADFARRESEILRTEKDQAEDASRAKTEFIGNISHEIRTPLNGVLGMVSVLLETHLTHEQREYVDLIKVSGDSLLSIVGNVLDIAEIESGKVVLDLKPFSFVQMAEEVAASLASRAHEKRVELSVWSDPAIPEALLGDEDRIRQVLTNLIGNAVKFTSQGEVAVRITSHPVLDSEPALFCVKTEVCDTGVGIPKNRISAVFDAFTQADGTTRRTFGGTGLGLAISKRLVERMGGTLSASSSVGIGSTFVFELELPRVDRRTTPRHTLYEGKSAALIGLSDSGALVLKTQLVESGIEVTQLGSFSALKEVPSMIAVDLDRITDAPDQVVQLRLQPGFESVPVIFLKMVGIARGSNDASHGSWILLKPIRRSQVRALLDQLFSGKDVPIDHEVIDEPTCRDMSVLVVEDNLINQFVAQKLLERSGARVTLASNGREALALFQKESFDLIFMDCQMPVMDGFEATRRIRSLECDSHIPIVAMTASSFTSDREACLAAGMDDFVGKPVTEERIKQIIARFIPPIES